MMSRLMLNLHESAKQGIFSTTAPTTSNTLQFEENELSVELDTLRTGEFLSPTMGTYDEEAVRSAASAVRVESEALGSSGWVEGGTSGR